MTDPNLAAGWSAMLLGAVSGAAIGLRFHIEGWAGGYASFRRRMLRLGHIAFFGLGLVNVLFALSVEAVGLPVAAPPVASLSLVVGVVTMPLVCFLTAWRAGFRHLFFVPVSSVVLAVVLVLAGGLVS